MSHAHAHHHDSESRLLWALLLISGFMLVEVVGGIFSGSLALLADAGHMLTDAASLALAWGASRVSKRPADALRTYGYQRLQILAALINGLAFIALVAWIIYEAIQRLAEPVQVMGGMMLVVAALGLLVNVVAFFMLHAGNDNDLNLRSAMIHVLGDLLGSVAAIVAAVVILLSGWMPIDPLLSILVALLILRSAWYVIRQSAHILLEGTPEDVDVELLRRTITESIAEVTDVHHVHVWSLTPERPLLSMHVSVVNGQCCAEVLTEVKKVLVEKFGIEHSTVQIESDGCVDKHP
jgi:cobalt-zinc-cadmium efflux system protein